MVLITGVTGHTGRFFLQQLMKNRYQEPIRCIVRETSNTLLLDNSGLNIEKMVGDLQDEVFLDRCMKGVDSVFHIVNIRYSLNIIEAAIKNDVKKVICVHTTGIFSKFRTASEEYLIIEKHINDILLKNEIKITILRPTMIYGDICDRNISRFIRMVDFSRILPVINHGKALIQPVNARDLGKAYYAALMCADEKLKPEYTLSGEKAVSILEMLNMISNNLGKRGIFISVPLSFGVILAKMLKFVTIGKLDYTEKVQRMSENRSFSHEEATRDFGYSPEPLETGIAREVKEYLSR